MKNFTKLLALAVCLCCTFNIANAAFGELTFSGSISCENTDADGSMVFVPGAPAGDYVAKITVPEENLGDLEVGGEILTVNGYSINFTIPDDENAGLGFKLSYGEAALKALGDFEEMTIPVSITPGNTLTSETGFGTSTANLTVSNDGCTTEEETEEAEEGSTLEDGLDSVEQPAFDTINVNELVSADQDLKVNFTVKIDANLFKLVVGELKEGEDITEKAKKLAERFSVKLDVKKLKKLARSELKKASKGLKGQEKKDAIEKAKQTGVNKLLSEILIKLPKVKGAKDKAEAKKIRKAKKKKILDALSVEVVEITDNEDESKKCLSFKVTLPAKVCAKGDGAKALVIAGQEIPIMGLELGESFTVSLPVKIVGLFRQFFGEENKKGKLNGKTTMELTLVNKE